MSVRRFDLEAGGETFAFLAETQPKIDFWLGKYPRDRKRSAVIPLLWLAQKDNGGWLSEPAMREVAERLEMPYIRVYEVATFYTMFQLQPVGRNHVQLCGTTPCMLRGANDLKAVCAEEIGPKGAVTDDGRLSWEEVECLGACVNAPMVQINDYYYEDLEPATFREILLKLRNGVTVEPGNFVDRERSGPLGGTDVLTDQSLFDGSLAQPLDRLPNSPEPAAEPEPEPTAMPEAAPPTNTERPNPEPKAADAAPDASDHAAEPVASTEAPADEVFEIGEDGLAGEQPDAVKVAARERDDLKRIKGVGPKIEETLNGLGIYKFAQVASWTRANVAWIDDYLAFKGRVDRERWIPQAQALAAGEAGGGEDED